MSENIDEPITAIRIKKTTRAELRMQGQMGDSYDSIILKLIRMAAEAQENESSK